MSILWFGAALVLVVATLGSDSAAATPPPSVDELPSSPTLPDPFRFEDGHRVKSRRDWPKRRAELKRLLRDAYGTLPPAGAKPLAESLSTTPLPDLHATERRLRLHMGPGGVVTTTLILTLPEGHGPFPTLIMGDLCWGEVSPDIVKAVIGRGYLLAEFDRTEVAPDVAEQTTGLHVAYPGRDFGAVAAWAWGFHRVVDYLLTLPEVDPKRIGVTGHSRGGKAALLAGALDERISITAPNNSGCMGAGCTRFPHDGETLKAITTTFPYWFASRLRDFVGREDRLPFDQHSVKALVAPRALLTTEGLGDAWANPEGTQLTFQAAHEVYAFLGEPGRIGIRFREGGHGHTLADWIALLDFADVQWRDRPASQPFDTLAFPDTHAKGYIWGRPQPSDSASH